MEKKRGGKERKRKKVVEGNEEIEGDFDDEIISSSSSSIFFFHPLLSSSFSFILLLSSQTNYFLQMMKFWSETGSTITVLNFPFYSSLFFLFSFFSFSTLFCSLFAHFFLKNSKKMNRKKLEVLNQLLCMLVLEIRIFLHLSVFSLHSSLWYPFSPSPSASSIILQTIKSDRFGIKVCHKHEKMR